MPYQFLQETFTPTVNQLNTIAVAAGGTGYTVGDILTLTGGTGTAATVQVATVAAGVVTGLTKLTGGAYTVNPGSPTATTGGTGTGCTITTTFAIEKGYLMAQKWLMDALSYQHVTGLSLQAGGTGYIVGDILTLNAAGAVGNSTCRIEVTAVAAGVITAFVMRCSGAFTTLPNFLTVGHPTTGGSGTGATFNVTSVDAAYTASQVAGGTGYVAGDIITISGGTLHAGAVAMQFRVQTVSGGAVTALTPHRFGRYDTMPTGTIATTGGSGTGLTVTLTKTGWTHPQANNSENYLDNLTNFSFWLEGVNGAGLNPFIGFKSIQFGTSRQWGIKAATGYNSANTFENQTNASPGDYTNPSGARGQRIPTTESAVTMFISYTPRVINGVSRTAPTYEHFMVGLWLPFIDSPATKYPAPLISAGTTRTDAVTINSAFDGRSTNSESTMHCSLLHHGEGAQGTAAGPHVVRDLLGAWTALEISAVADSAFTLWPLCEDEGGSTPAAAPNIETGSGSIQAPNPVASEVAGDDIGNTSSGTGGMFNNNNAMNPTPFGPGGQNLYFLTAPLLYQINIGSPMQLYGELEGAYYINARGLSAEDRITDAAGVRYFVFPDTLSNENRNFIAIREG